MFNDAGTARLRATFAAQFQPDGDAFVYRKYSKGAPIRVTAAEREGFVRNYNRFLSWAFWGTITATSVLILVLTFLSIRFGMEVSFIPVWIGLALILVPFLIANSRAFNEPAKALAGRLPEGVPRSRSEMRRLHLSRMSYMQIASAVFAPSLIAVGFWLKGNHHSAWSALWLVLACALIGLGALQAFRKWRLESEPAERSDNNPNASP